MIFIILIILIILIVCAGAAAGFHSEGNVLDRAWEKKIVRIVIKFIMFMIIVSAGPLNLNYFFLNISANSNVIN